MIYPRTTCRDWSVFWLLRRVFWISTLTGLISYFLWHLYDFTHNNFPQRDLAYLSVTSSIPNPIRRIESTQVDEFNVTSSGAPIPKIIHQHWVTYDIPVGIKQEWLTSWLAHNPDWDYWFWSEDDVRCFLEREFPWFVKYYNSYTVGKNNGGLFRGDAMRYFILYHYGGVYADLDAECLKPLEELVADKYCIIPEENPVHPFLIFGAKQNNLVNAVMMCASGHPFMLEVAHELPNSVNNSNVLYSTGPHLVTKVWRRYISRLSVLSNKSESDNVTVANYKLLNPSFDPNHVGFVRWLCASRIYYPSLGTEGKHVCDELIERNFTNTPDDESFTNHHWVHMSLDKNWENMTTVDIRHVVNKVFTYQTMFGNASHLWIGLSP